LTQPTDATAARKDDVATHRPNVLFEYGHDGGDWAKLLYALISRVPMEPAERYTVLSTGRPRGTFQLSE
jgi:hypothetical protein